MTSTVRYATIFNGTGEVLTPASSGALVTTGLDGSLRTFRRSFAAADIGEEAGQTRDGTDPAVGCLLFSISGSLIKRVISFSLYRPTSIRNTQFFQIRYSTDQYATKISWRIVNQNNLSSLYIIDIASNSAAYIAENDFLEVLVATGNQDPA